jgi:hypothetical protein
VTIKTALLVTFDFSQRGKSGTGLAAASLMAACHQHKDYGNKFSIQHLPISMSTTKSEQYTASDISALINKHTDLRILDRLALACYVWSSSLIEPIIKLCRLSGFSGKIILGGYQIHKDSCRSLYPSGDFYIPGYAEAALPEAILDDKSITSRIIDINVNIDELPSPYLNGTISLERGHKMIHWETRRGCIFTCNFCAHRDLKNKEVNLLSLTRIKDELSLFRKMDVGKINILDPLFNRENRQYSILQYAVDIGLTSLITLQVRFEFVTNEFLALCAKLNVHLEFGLQTASETESIIIERRNNMIKVGETIKLLNKWQQSFEVSLIYGLPGQTVSSFKESINYLENYGVEIIKAFPLMLLEGTQLSKEREKYKIEEDFIDDTGIPHVISSYSFTRNEWHEMRHSANQLIINMEAA